MDVKSLSPTCIILNLFIQLLPKDGEWIKDFSNLVLRKDQREPPPAGLRDLHELIQKASKYHKRVTVVVDALDECHENREEVFTLLRDMSRAKNISIVVSSRKDHDIDMIFQGFPSVSLTSLRDKIEVDMKAYIKEQLQSRSRLSTLPIELKVEIESSFVEKADGM